MPNVRYIQERHRILSSNWEGSVFFVHVFARTREYDSSSAVYAAKTNGGWIVLKIV
jgi:hypothetical protein